MAEVCDNVNIRLACSLHSSFKLKVIEEKKPQVKAEKQKSKESTKLSFISFKAIKSQVRTSDWLYYSKIYELIGSYRCQSRE